MFPSCDRQKTRVQTDDSKNRCQYRAVKLGARQEVHSQKGYDSRQANNERHNSSGNARENSPSADGRIRNIWSFSLSNRYDDKTDENAKVKYGASSGHGGVVNHLFGDGAVWSISKEIDVAVYMFLITRRNGDPSAG